LVEFGKFSQKLLETVAEKSKALPTEVPPLFEKEQFQQEQQAVISQLTKMLTSERKRAYEEFDRLGRSASVVGGEGRARARSILANYRYLAEIAKPGILELKLALSSEK